MFFCSNFRVGFIHINNKNCLSNQGILSILEEAAEMHSSSIGCGIHNISDTHQTWALLNWKVQVSKRPKYGDNLIVKTWAKSANKFYTYRDFEVYDENNNLLIIATSKWVLINVEKNSLTRIEDSFYTKYQPENKSVFNITELPKLTEPEFSKETYQYSVKRNDIDVNGHMHNVNYLSLVYEALPENVYNNNQFNNFEILYKKEIKFGDTVKCFYSCEDIFHTVTIKSNNENTLHAIIKLY